MNERLTEGVLGVLGFSLLVFVGGKAYGDFFIDRDIARWSAGMVAKLDDARLDGSKLLEGERFYPKVRVVGRGRTLEEALGMEGREGRIDVRNFPGAYLNEVPFAGFGTKVIGQVAIGSMILNVILYENGWGVTKCDDIKGLVLKDPTQKPRICTIYGEYIKAGE